MARLVHSTDNLNPCPERESTTRQSLVLSGEIFTDWMLQKESPQTYFGNLRLRIQEPDTRYGIIRAAELQSKQNAETNM